MHSSFDEALELLSGVITRSKALPDFVECSSRRRSSTPPRAPITLDYAVSVIRSLEQSSPDQEKTIFTRGEINSMVQAAMLAGFRDFKADRGLPSPRKPNRKRGQSDSMPSSAAYQAKEDKAPRPNPKKRSSERYCFDFGAKDHIRGALSLANPPAFAPGRVAKRGSIKMHLRRMVTPRHGFFRRGS